MFFQAQTQERAHAEVADAVVLARGHDGLVQAVLVFGRDPDFVAQVAGVADAVDQRRHVADGHVPGVHEFERGVAHVLIAQAHEHVTGLGASNRQADELHAQGLDLHRTVGRQVLFEPTHVIDLRLAAAPHHEFAIGELGDGEVADQLALGVEHRGEDQTTRLGHGVGHHVQQPGLGARTLDAVLGEVGDLGHAHGFAHGTTLLADGAEIVAAVKGHGVFGLFARGCVPQRGFHAPAVAHDRALCAHHVVQRRGLLRAGCGQFFVGEADAKAPRIVLAHLGVGVVAGGPVAVARHVHAPNIKAGVAIDHPVGERQTDAATLTETGHHTAGAPEVAQAFDRAHQGVAVGCEGEGAVDHALDAGVFQGGEMLEGDFQRRRDAVQVGLQQLLAKTPRGGAGGPWHTGLLVHAEHHALAFLAQVTFGAEVDHVTDLFARGLVERLDFGDVVGHQVHVFHGQDRQLNAHHAADFAGPQAAAVDHVFGVDVALVGAHRPAAVGAL